MAADATGSATGGRRKRWLARVIGIIAGLALGWWTGAKLTSGPVPTPTTAPAPPPPR